MEQPTRLERALMITSALLGALAVIIFVIGIAL